MDSLNITSAQYITTPDENNVEQNHAIRIVADGKKMFAPLDTSHDLYAEIMRQVEAGELTIQDADS